MALHEFRNGRVKLNGQEFVLVPQSGEYRAQEEAAESENREFLPVREPHESAFPKGVPSKDELPVWING